MSGAAPFRNAAAAWPRARHRRAWPDGGSSGRDSGRRRAASSREALHQAGATPGDIDVAEFHARFTTTVIVELEDLGFCTRGEGGPSLRKARSAPAEPRR